MWGDCWGIFMGAVLHTFLFIREWQTRWHTDFENRPSFIVLAPFLVDCVALSGAHSHERKCLTVAGMTGLLRESAPF